jgi:hypothetical protein
MTSEYEKTRLANIKRNEDFLKHIGLDDLQQEMRVTVENERQQSSGTSMRNPAAQELKRKQDALAEGELGTPELPRRRSRRLQAVPLTAREKVAGVSSQVEEEVFLYLKDGQGKTYMGSTSAQCMHECMYV